MRSSLASLSHPVSYRLHGADTRHLREPVGVDSIAPVDRLATSAHLADDHAPSVGVAVGPVTNAPACLLQCDVHARIHTRPRIADASGHRPASGSLDGTIPRAAGAPSVVAGNGGGSEFNALIHAALRPAWVPATGGVLVLQNSQSGSPQHPPKRLHSWIDCLFSKLIWFTELHDLAVLNEHQPIADRACEFDVVGNENERDALLT